MAQTSIHYEKWLWGDNSININGRIMVLVYCPFSYCHLSTTKFNINPFCTFKDMTQADIHYEKYMVMGR